MRCALRLSAMVLTGVVRCAATASAQSARPVLTVRTATGQTTFRVGERIALELSFSGPEGKFEVNTASYDRSGRMSYEEFKVQPEAGWSDPLASYFAESGGAGGGIFGIAALSPTKPVTVVIDLNQWVRFDRPGAYRVSVVSRRVSEPEKGLVWSETAQRRVASEPIELQIVAATPAWQAERLGVTVQALERAAQPGMMGAPPPAATSAIADLRYLATPGAIAAMARNLRDDRPDRIYQCAFGLLGVPEAMREVALAAMRRQIQDPAFPVSGWFMTVMPVLEGGTSEPERMEKREAIWREILDSLPRKQGKARALTAQTLQDNPAGEAWTENKSRLAAVLAESFAELPEEAQANELQYRWDALRSESMLPRLKAAAMLPLDDAGSNEMSHYNRRGLKAAALERWYELDPEGAREEVLREIGRAKPSLTAQSLAWFPKQPLPQFEQVWAQALVGGSGDDAVLAGLLARYGSGAAVAQVKAKIEGGTTTLPSALAYMVEFDPDEARPLLRRALGQREGCERGCFSSLFQDVARQAHGPALTDVALEALGNVNADVVNDALIYLAAYGDERAEAPVTKGYFEWAERWAGKAAHFETREAGSFVPANYQEINRGVSLGRAVIASQGWLADEKTIARVVGACVGEPMCQQLRQIADMAAAPYRVTLYRDANGTENHQLAQYTAKSMELLEAKLKQFPRGTNFVLEATAAETEDQKRLEAEATAVFARTGMTLVRKTD